MSFWSQERDDVREQRSFLGEGIRKHAGTVKLTDKARVSALPHTPVGLR